MCAKLKKKVKCLCGSNILPYNMSPVLCISDSELQRKVLEKYSSNLAIKNRRRKSYGTVALRFPIPTL